MKIYLAGPMTGLPRSNFEMFDNVARIMRDYGHEVISPADLDRGLGIDPDNPETLREIDWSQVMRMDLRHVLDCDGILMLPGWENSRGARLERTVAESTGRLVLVWDEKLLMARYTTPWFTNEIIYVMGRRLENFVQETP